MLHDSVLTFPAGAITATRQSRWIRTAGLQDWSVALHTAATGSPNGVYSFEGSNDRVCGLEIDQNVLPAATAAKKFTIVTPAVVHGDSLTLTGSAANSYVAFVGMPNYMRVVYTFSSGGAANSPTMITGGFGPSL
jgi:hypothetical protein